MKNLETVLKDKKLEDLESEKVEKGSNFIEPTSAMIEQVLTLSKEGKTLPEIKKLVKKEGTNFTLSFGQVGEILEAKQKKIAELTAPVDREINLEK